MGEEEKIPFDYDKYAADRSAWKVYANNGEEIAFLMKSPDGHDSYPFKGVILNTDGVPTCETWQGHGWYHTEPDADKNISHMVPIHKEKPVEPSVVSSLTPRLRNIFYNREDNAVMMGVLHHNTWVDAVHSAKRTCRDSPHLEHLCVSALEDHPQIREILIAKGLTEIVVDKLRIKEKV